MEMLSTILQRQDRTDAAVDALTRAQENSSRRLDEAMSLLTTISSDMAALRSGTRLVAEVPGGATGGTGSSLHGSGILPGSSLSAGFSSMEQEVEAYLPSQQFTMEDAAQMGASLAASLDRFLPGQGNTGSVPSSRGGARPSGAPK